MNDASKSSRTRPTAPAVAVAPILSASRTAHLMPAAANESAQAQPSGRRR